MKKLFLLSIVVSGLILFSVTGVSAFSGGNGSSENPYQISTCTELQAMQNGLALNYVLVNDIDCSDTVNWNSGAGFVPIGTGSQFTGTFDGQGHTITGLFINTPSAYYVGLFGVTGSGAIIKNVGLVNVNINCYNYSGELVGVNYGTITNSYVTGIINGGYTVGGLVGQNYGTITNSYSTGSVGGPQYIGGLVGSNNGGTITNCYSTESVGGGYLIGGLVGVNGGAITYSYATGDVSGWGGDVGGLVGANGGTITNCYATGSATGSGSPGYLENLGGLVGVNGGPITNSYSTGSVNGNGWSRVGGLVGANNEGSGTVTSSYWDKQTSGQLTSVGGTGKTTAAMKTQATFADWDFANVWAIYPTKNNGYPYFLWQIFKDAGCPCGMVSYWKFDETSGTTAYDSVGDNNGQLMNSVHWTTGQVGGAISLDQPGDYVDILTNGFPIGNSARSLSAWVYQSSANYAYILQYGVTETNHWFDLFVYGANDAIIRSGFYWNDWLINYALPIGQWAFLTLTYDGITTTFYANGVLVDSNSARIATNTVLGNVYHAIGGQYGYPQFSFNGKIDEVAIWNRALTADEIQRQYQNGLAGEGYCDDFPPVIAAHDDIIAEATSSAGAVVNYVLPIATDDYDTSVIVTGTPISGSIFALGDTIVKCDATDAVGNQAIQTSFKVRVEDTTPPIIAAHADVTAEATSSAGAIVTYTSPATYDEVDGAGTATCLPASGSTFHVGTNTVTCTATDAHGNKAANTTFNVIVRYNWDGFVQPVDNPPTFNQVKAGSAIPLKFSLGGNMGLSIFATNYPASQKIACDSAAPVDDIEATVNAGGSSLTYDPLANQYNYVWKTDKLWAGTCRQLVIKLSDGTIFYANFKFK